MSQTGGVLARRPSIASRVGQQGCTRELFSWALFFAKSPRWHFALSCVVVLFLSALVVLGRVEIVVGVGAAAR